MQVAISGLRGLFTPPFRTALQHPHCLGQRKASTSPAIVHVVADGQSLVTRTRSSVKDSSHLTMQACTGKDEVWSSTEKNFCFVWLFFSFTVVMWAALEELYLIPHASQKSSAAGSNLLLSMQKGVQPHFKVTFTSC